VAEDNALESYPDYLARKAAQAAAAVTEVVADEPTAKKAKGVEDKAIKAGEAEDKATE
jgi:hypothetical protein